MERLSTSNIVLLVVGVALVLIVMLCSTAAPYTPSGKKGRCRHELSSIRGMLLADESRVGIAFENWQEWHLADTCTKMDIMGGYCKIFSSQFNETILHFRSVGHEVRIVDPWGNDYNVGNLEKLSRSVSRDLARRIAIADLLVWSSGPNGVNELGGGDDVFEINLKQWD